MTYHIFIGEATVTVWLSSGGVTVHHVELESVQECSTHCTHTHTHTHSLSLSGIHTCTLSKLYSYIYTQSLAIDLRQTLSGILHLQYCVGAGWVAIGEGGDGDRGNHSPPLTLLHLNPHHLQQLVTQSVSHIKLVERERERERERRGERRGERGG